MINKMRNNIIETISKALPERLTCKTHGGRFSAQELKRLGAKAPAVFAACLGLAKIESTGEGTVATLGWAVFVITKDERNADRDAAALALVAQLMPVIAENCWGLDDYAGIPQGLRGDNLYSGQIEKKGVAMWAIPWQQELLLDRLDADQLENLETLHIDWDLAPVDGTVDTTDDIDLTLIEGESP